MKSSKAIIIGSGIAGMAAAIRLSLKGFEVTVFEKNATPGGKLSAFEKDGFHFDAGPSLFTQPVNIEDLFELAGEPIAEYFSYKKLDSACRYFFANGQQLDAFTDPEAFDAEIAGKLGEKPGAVKRYLADAGKLYQRIGSVFLNFSLHKRSTWLHPRIFKALSATKFGYLANNLHKHNSQRFSGKEAQQLFDRYATYNGSNPYKAPSMLSLIPHLEQKEGAFYPEGGMISITNAVYKLALKTGVKFRFNEPVERIIHHEGKVHGVFAAGKNNLSDIVISNGDVYFTYRNLLRHDRKASKIGRRERSSSALIFYWGIGHSFPQLQLHNVFFSEDYQLEFTEIFRQKIAPSDPTIYINITSKMENGLAPEGKENWFVMVNVPANTGQDWEEMINKVRETVILKLTKLLGQDIRSLIQTEEILDPILIEERTGSFRGSLYGSSSNSKLAAFFRPANFSSYAKNLYFCGGSVHPGGGLPLCFKSAKIATDLISKDYKKIQH
ncbi:MAG: crtI [Ferruginibacter sp.]|nr:crtI [Ferruginibacter sp.]